MATKKAKKPFSKAPLGSGWRFKACTQKMKRQGKSDKSARAICASIWIKKYWKKQMAKWAAKWRRK